MICSLLLKFQEYRSCIWRRSLRRRWCVWMSCRRWPIRMRTTWPIESIWRFDIFSSTWKTFTSFSFLQRTISKTIPYIPVHLRDILYLEDIPETVTLLKEGKTAVNFEKYYKLYMAQKYLLSFREKPSIHLPKICVTDEATEYIYRCILLKRNEDDLYEMSYAIKPHLQWDIHKIFIFIS